MIIITIMMVMMMMMIMIIIIIVIIIMIIIIIIIVIVIVIVGLKGANRWGVLCNLLCAANCLQHVLCSGLGAIVCKSRAAHRVTIACNMSCAVWYEGEAQLSSLTEFKSHLFQPDFIG